MADIMGGSGLAFYEWKKHGRCSGLSATAYYSAMRRAYASVAIPPIFAHISKDLKVPALVIEDAFLENNPGLEMCIRDSFGAQESRRRHRDDG